MKKLFLATASLLSASTLLCGAASLQEAGKEARYGNIEGLNTIFNSLKAITGSSTLQIASQQVDVRTGKAVVRNDGIDEFRLSGPQGDAYTYGDGAYAWPIKGAPHGAIENETASASFLEKCRKWYIEALNEFRSKKRSNPSSGKAFMEGFNLGLENSPGPGPIQKGLDRGVERAVEELIYDAINPYR